MNGMILEWAIIRSFRSIEHVDLPLEGPVVLVGANGVGKSNILEALARTVPERTALVRGDGGAPPVSFVFRMDPGVPEASSWLHDTADFEARLAEAESYLAERGQTLDREFFRSFAHARFMDEFLARPSSDGSAASLLAGMVRQIALLAPDNLVGDTESLFHVLTEAPLIELATPVWLLGDRRLLTSDRWATIERLASVEGPLGGWATNVLHDPQPLIRLFALGVNRRSERAVVQVVEHEGHDLEAFVANEIPQLYDRYWTVRDDEGDLLTWRSEPWDGSSSFQGWAEPTEGGGVRPRSGIDEVLGTIEQYTNDKLPRFVSAVGTVVFTITPIDKWNDRPKVTVVLRERSGAEVPFEYLSSGIQRWGRRHGPVLLPASP